MNSVQSQKHPEMQPEDVISQARQIMDKYSEKSTKEFGRLFNNPYVLDWSNIHRQLHLTELLRPPAAKTKKRVTIQDQLEPSAKRVKQVLENTKFSLAKNLRV